MDTRPVVSEKLAAPDVTHRVISNIFSNGVDAEDMFYLQKAFRVMKQRQVRSLNHDDNDILHSPRHNAGQSR